MGVYEWCFFGCLCVFLGGYVVFFFRYVFRVGMVVMGYVYLLDFLMEIFFGVRIGGLVFWKSLGGDKGE